MSENAKKARDFDVFDVKTTQFSWETENSERQMKDKHGHVVISTVCRLV